MSDKNQINIPLMHFARVKQTTDALHQLNLSIIRGLDSGVQVKMMNECQIEFHIFFRLFLLRDEYINRRISASVEHSIHFPIVHLEYKYQFRCELDKLIFSIISAPKTPSIGTMKTLTMDFSMRSH